MGPIKNLATSIVFDFYNYECICLEYVGVIRLWSLVASSCSYVWFSDNHDIITLEYKKVLQQIYEYVAWYIYFFDN